METQPACLLAMGGKQPWAIAPTKKSLPLVMSGRKKVLSLRLWSGRLDILLLWPWVGIRTSLPSTAGTPWVPIVGSVAPCPHVPMLACGLWRCPYGFSPLPVGCCAKYLPLGALSTLSAHSATQDPLSGPG